MLLIAHLIRSTACCSRPPDTLSASFVPASFPRAFWRAPLSLTHTRRARARALARTNCVVRLSCAGVAAFVSAAPYAALPPPPGCAAPLPHTGSQRQLVSLAPRSSSHVCAGGTGAPRGRPSTTTPGSMATQMNPGPGGWNGEGGARDPPHAAPRACRQDATSEGHRQPQSAAPRAPGQGPPGESQGETGTVRGTSTRAPRPGEGGQPTEPQVAPQDPVRYRLVSRDEVTVLVRGSRGACASRPHLPDLPAPQRSTLGVATPPARIAIVASIQKRWRRPQPKAQVVEEMSGIDGLPFRM